MPEHLVSSINDVFYEDWYEDVRNPRHFQNGIERAQIRSRNSIRLPPPPSMNAGTNNPPMNIFGHLFSDTQLNDGTDSEPATVGLVHHDLGHKTGNRLMDEERASKKSPFPNTSLAEFMPNRLRRWFKNQFPTLKEDNLGSIAQSHHGKSRKRRVIVVEYGNTDDVTEGTLIKLLY